MRNADGAAARRSGGVRGAVGDLSIMPLVPLTQPKVNLGQPKVVVLLIVEHWQSLGIELFPILHNSDAI